ncbi:hypothetical protein RIF29_39050 [Crotalaria pallida]|uniref:Mitochondrial inner membrane protease ATP23 n=1 Tax=Crotalaria pallida TaxID=3830 RepID=A0AAN9HPG5_CROPI
MSEKPTAPSVTVLSAPTGKTVEECQSMIQKSLQTPTVRFLRKHLEKAGCAVGDNFFRAMHCNPEMQAQGGYLPGGGVRVCSNYTQLQEQVDRVVTHELIVAFDHCRAANLDWNNCAHLACTEIRAGHLSGDCNFKRELLRGYMKLQGHEQECIRRRVMESLNAIPNCAGTAGKDSMEAVWNICYNDTQPFDRAP